MVGCIVLTHGDLCFGLRDTLEGIMGKQKGLSVISNVGLGKEELVAALLEQVNHPEYGSGAVIFVDMFGTSCWQTAKKVACTSSRDGRPVAVITGVNLPMLVKFFSLRESCPVDQMMPLIKEEGEKGIKTES